MSTRTHNETRVSTRSLNKSQRRAVRRIMRFIWNRNSHSDVTSARFELTRPFGSFLSMTVTTRRSDCEEYSERAVICEQRLHCMIGPRGGLKVCSFSNGLSDSTAHAKKMLRR